MKILLIGCGRTGRAIAQNIIDIKELTKLSFYIRTLKSSRSLAYDLDNKKIEVLSNIHNLQTIDYILIALSGMSDSAREKSFERRENTYQVRQDELKFNIGAITNLIEDLKDVPQKVPIVLITNPVDEITKYLRIKLKKENIFGFGMSLDARRYEKELGKKVYCIGTHGKAIPLIDSKNEIQYNVLSKKTDGELLEYIRKHGIPHKMAGIVFKDFFEKLISKDKKIIHVSYYLKDKFDGVKDISVSLPWEVQKGKTLKIANFKMNSIERKRFIKSTKELKKSVKHILETHKKLIEHK